MKRLAETYSLFFILSGIVYAVYIITRLIKIKSNNGNKLLYSTAVITLLTRELNILSQVLNPQGKTYMLLLPLVYGLQSFLLITSYAMMYINPFYNQFPRKARCGNTSQPQRYFSWKEDVQDLLKYLKNHNTAFCTFLVWNLLLLILVLIVVYSPGYSYLAARVAGLFLAFSYCFGAYDLNVISYTIKLDDDSTMKVDRISTCYIILGVINIFIVAYYSFYIEYFLVFQTCAYLFEALSIHNYATLLHNNEKMEFVEFNKIARITFAYYRAVLIPLYITLITIFAKFESKNSLAKNGLFAE